MQPALGTGRDREHLGWLSLQALRQGRAHVGPPAGMPGGLHEDPPEVGVASLGDGALGPAFARGALTGHEADEGHERGCALEAAEVPDLDRDGQRAELGDAAQGTEAGDGGRERWSMGDRMQRVVEELSEARRMSSSVR